MAARLLLLKNSTRANTKVEVIAVVTLHLSVLEGILWMLRADSLLFEASLEYSVTRLRPPLNKALVLYRGLGGNSCRVKFDLITSEYGVHDKDQHWSLRFLKTQAQFMFDSAFPMAFFVIKMPI